MSKVIQNYIYNLSFQFINLLIPLSTVPYLSRILGAEGIGSYSYYYSIAILFSQLIVLGMGNYGNRCIAKCLDDKKRLSVTFTELFYLQFIIGIFVVSGYVGFALFLADDTQIALCFLLVLLSSLFDTNWYLYGRENFKIISIRGIVIKILTTASIFLFVKKESDVLIYALIMAGSIFLTQIIAWPIILQEITFVKIQFSNVFKHIKPNLILFIPIVAVSVYRTISKIMLGSFTTVTEVGYFENAEKIVSVLLSIIVALGTVMLPRMTALIETKDETAISSLMNKTFVYISFISGVFCFGLFAIAEDLVLWFLGDGFQGSVKILRLLCLTIPFICFANMIRTQILIPRSFDKPYVISCIVGAIINLISNLIFIKMWNGSGAAFSTLLAEITVFLVQLGYCKNVLANHLYGKHVKMLCHVYLYGVVMAFVLMIIRPLVELSGFNLLITQIIIGGIIYIILLILHLYIVKTDMLCDFLQTITFYRKN